MKQLTFLTLPGEGGPIAINTESIDHLHPTAAGHTTVVVGREAFTILAPFEEVTNLLHHCLGIAVVRGERVLERWRLADAARKETTP